MGRMEIGIGLPVRLVAESPERLLEWAVRADEGPFSTIAVMDRVVYPALEPLVTLAAAAAVTRRVRLLTSILLVPTRETTLLARQAASIDALSGGRLSIGTGVGVREDDYAVTGVPFRRRGARLDEQLPSLRRIWNGEPGAATSSPIGPRPARPNGPELLIGGYVDAVARRIARWGDGFMAPGGGDPDRMTALWTLILDAWTDEGRPGRPRRLGGSYFALGPNAEAAARSHIDTWYGFDPALAERRIRSIPMTDGAVRDVIVRNEDLGVDELILRPCTADPDQFVRLAELVAGRTPG
jgi:alkanesulfonate monooxygenase SsuD/methylene tetrahydromethanopterin reductase-like flavin-dependent oxidoreductase (luciferase family)